ncbi:hypothetical protein ACEPPN_001505 [Leptodophora sp. 'Broadleaf-Isolate-01']
MLFSTADASSGSGSAEKLTINTIQSVITDEGDWVFNATGYLYWSSLEKWDVIPAGKRDTRTTIKAAADAYLDSWGDSSVKVPYGASCARLEGGAYTGTKTTTANTCKMPQFPLPFKIANRRYVVDEEVGAVDVFNDFPFIDKSIESSKDESIMGNQEISKKYITSFPSYKESPMRFLNDSAFISRTFSVHLLLRIPNPI